MADDIERQLSAIAKHSVAQSRAANPEQSTVHRGRRSRALVALSAGLTVAAVVTVAVVAVNRDDHRTTVRADSDRRSAAADGPQEYEATATVLESKEHGPELCFSVALSYPPQCGGPD